MVQNDFLWYNPINIPLKNRQLYKRYLCIFESGDRNKQNMMLKPTTWLVLVYVSICSHYSLKQTLQYDDAVEGVGIAHGLAYVGVGYFDGILKIYEKNGTQLSLHQTISDSRSVPIWDLAMTNDHWLAVAFRNYPVIYVLNNSTQKFERMQELEEFGVYAIQISADHQYLVLGNENGYAVVYYLVDGKYQKSHQVGGPGDRVWSLSLTADGKELGIGRDGWTVNVFVNNGGIFQTNLTINTPDPSFKRVKIADSHKCFVVGSREQDYVLVYKRVGHDLVLSQNITDFGISAYSVDVSSDCKELVIGTSTSGFYYESNGSIFKQVQQLPCDSQALMRASINVNHRFIFLGSLSGALYVYSMDSSSHLTSS